MIIFNVLVIIFNVLVIIFNVLVIKFCRAERTVILGIQYTISLGANQR